MIESFAVHFPFECLCAWSWLNRRIWSCACIFPLRSFFPVEDRLRDAFLSFSIVYPFRSNTLLLLVSVYVRLPDTCVGVCMSACVCVNMRSPYKLSPQSQHGVVWIWQRRRIHRISGKRKTERKSKTYFQPKISFYYYAKTKPNRFHNFKIKLISSSHSSEKCFLCKICFCSSHYLFFFLNSR